MQILAPAADLSLSDKYRPQHGRSFLDRNSDLLQSERPYWPSMTFSGFPPSSSS